MGMGRIGEWLRKLENLARTHSKQADQLLDRAEAYAKQRTGHKYDDQITKGVDAVQSRYGGGGQQQPGQQPSQQPSQQQGQQPVQQPGRQPQPESQEERERRMPPQG